MSDSTKPRSTSRNEADRDTADAPRNNAQRQVPGVHERQAQQAGPPTDVGEAETQQPAAATDGDGAQGQIEPVAPEAREPSTGFPVVGVGASAGGVEALQAFLSRLPRTRKAFVRRS